LKWLPIAGRISPLLRPDKITGMYLFDSLFTWNMPALKDASLHIILPSLALGLIISSVFLRMVRGNMVLMLSQDFVKAARARGIKENSVIYRQRVYYIDYNANCHNYNGINRYGTLYGREISVSYLLNQVRAYSRPGKCSFS